ncbi:MAG: hypothetical protein ACQES5_11285 [Thermodesulfobacteriota bacterium]
MAQICARNQKGSHQKIYPLIFSVSRPLARASSYPGIQQTSPKYGQGRFLIANKIGNPVLLLNSRAYISGNYVFGMQVADLWSRTWQPVRRWVDCAQNRGYYYRQCEFLTVFLGDVMKALIFMFVSGFILCLPHAQAIAANSVCQKVCAGGGQKCLDCCAENYGTAK